MLNAFHWRQIFTLESAGVKTLKLFSSHGGFLIYAMPHHRDNILIKLAVTHYDETQKRAYDSQIVIATENLKLRQVSDMEGAFRLINY